MYRTCLAITLIASACAFIPALPAADKNALKDALALEAAVEDAIKQAEPSIACIIVSRSDAYQRLFQEPPPRNPGQLGPFEPIRSTFSHRRRRDSQDEELRKYDLADPRNVPEAYGSGVVLDGKELLILTNYHVVRGATKLYVRLPGGRGSYANIHAADPRSDLAVLQLLDKSLRPLPALKFGDGGNVQKGQFVVGLANPFAAGFRDGSPSASWGIVSNIHRRAPGTMQEEERKIPLHLHPILFQTDARLNLGCSGGALLNLSGEWIGLTTARAAINGSDTAGGFAIPLDRNIQRIVARLREGRESEYGFLGVGPGVHLQDGVSFLIGDITPGSPAEKAGLRPGERIVSVNGIRVHNFEDLVLTVGLLMAGSKVDLELQNHSSRMVSVTLAKHYVPGPVIASNRPSLVRGLRVDYTSVLTLKYAASGQYQIIHPGVLVSEVETGSPAAAKLKEGDIITHIRIRSADVAVNTPDEFYREAAKLNAREPLWLILLNSTEPVRID
jgi:S1-C subfamily serine protease